MVLNDSEEYEVKTDKSMSMFNNEEDFDWTKEYDEGIRHFED